MIQVVSFPFRVHHQMSNSSQFLHCRKMSSLSNSVVIVISCFVLLCLSGIEGQPPQEGCPYEGLYHYPHETDCEKYYLCKNGTGTLEECPNGLLYQEHGAVYEFCAYYWKVDCPKGKTAPGPVSSSGCPWQFGIFPEGSPDECTPSYSECVWGVPERKYCERGLVYDERIKGCQWPDQKGCRGEDQLGVKCPAEDKYNPFYPYPRYYNDARSIVVCVNDQPRLIQCPEGQLVDSSALTCIDVHKDDRHRN